MAWLLQLLANPTFRRWALAIFAALVLLVSDRVGFMLSDEQRNQLLILVLGVVGMSNINDMVTKRNKIAAKAGEDAMKKGTATELNK